jgi:hypothetical protein
MTTVQNRRAAIAIAASGYPEAIFEITVTPPLTLGNQLVTMP